MWALGKRKTKRKRKRKRNIRTLKSLKEEEY